MPSTLATEDQPMGDAPNATANGEDSSVDMNEGPRIRVVSNLIPPTVCCGADFET